MCILGEDADMIWMLIKIMSRITKLEFVDGPDWQCNGNHTSYGEGYICRICEGVVRCKKIPQDVTQSLGRIFTTALHAAQAARLELESFVTHMTHAHHTAIGAKTNGFSAFRLTLPDVDQIGSYKFWSFTHLSILTPYLDFFSHQSAW
jgi:hypothetical protein